ncbi:hypothetical protein Tco_0857585 [Tanacetum coccineum]|uniref:Myb-like domain-containing protein n=1 Tax=Tanacetum coccineum TaxID=301880 RepID=A0ABQ5B9R5_9ASTR
MAKTSTVDLDEDNEEEEQSRHVSRWTREEEILLCQCWVEIIEHFNQGTFQGTRTEKMLTGKWFRINGHCQKFNAVYKHLERKSEKNEATHIETVKTNFMAQSKGRKILLEHAGKKKGLVTHDLEGYGLEKTCNNDKNLSEIQLEHEKEDEFVVVVVKVVHECRHWMDWDCMMVVKEIVSRLLEEEDKLEWWFEQDIDEEDE